MSSVGRKRIRSGPIIIITSMQKKEKIRNLFDDIAPEYDKLNHILSLDIDKSWRRKAVRKTIDTHKKMQILDVACGTGDFALAIARKAAPGSRITGIDLSEGMMKIGREKISREGMEDMICLRQGDCESLEFPDSTFDRVTAAFGVRNFENIPEGLRQMHRVLKDGGKLVILELSVPQNRLMFFLYKIYFKGILPKIGGKISGNRGAYEYLPASVINFPAPSVFCRMISEAGFTKVTVKAFTFGLCRLFTAIK